MRTALVVGGTGPTGVHIVEGLVERGFAVTIFHRGVHEAGVPAVVEHIHGDPHFEDTIREALGERTFDVVVATYGRTRVLAGVLADRCSQFVGVGGVPIYAGYIAPDTQAPTGMPVLAAEDRPLVDGAALALHDDPVTRDAAAFATQLVATERVVFELDAADRFGGTWFRYPMIYDGGNLAPWTWPVVRRLLDGRRELILPDGGLGIHTRSAPRNAAHAVLLAVDQPEAARGKVFNCGDDEQFSMGQWVEMIISHMGVDAGIVSMPLALAAPAYGMLPNQGTSSPHALVDTSRVRDDLGYRDVVAPRVALGEVVDQLVASHGSGVAWPILQDPFDYELEDRLIAAYRQAVDDLRLIVEPLLGGRPMHGYPHPRASGTAVDHRGR